VQLYVIATLLHIAVLKGTGSLSPFEGSAQFSENNFCSKDFVPEATGYSKSCFMMCEVVLVVVTLHVIEV